MSTLRAPAEPRRSAVHRRPYRYNALNSAEDSTAPGSGGSVRSSRVDDSESTASSVEFPSVERAREKMADVKRALQGCPFFVLNLLDGTSFDGNATTNLIAVPSEFKKEVTAIIIVCSLCRKMDVQRYLFELRTATRPIIVLCVDEGERFPTEEVLHVQHGFLELGASDLVLQSNCGNNLHMELLMRVQTAMRANHVRRNEVSKRLEKQRRTMLWPFVHRIMEGFPQLNETFDWQTSSRQLQQRIQSGSFGTVFKCKNVANGQEEVVKVLPKNSAKHIQQVAEICNEIVLMQRLQHPNVIAFKGAQHTPEYILIFMDFAGPQNLHAYLEASSSTLDLREKLSITGQILAGLGHCHEVCIAHRDMKPENIVVTFLDDGRIHVRIVDFGLAIESTKACTDLVGTVPFMAPEIITRHDREQYDPARADIWACGVVFLEILCGIGKFNRMLQWSRKPSCELQYRQDVERFFRIKNRITASVQVDIGLVGSASFPQCAHACLLGMLTLDPCCRWSATTAIESLTFESELTVMDCLEELAQSH